MYDQEIRALAEAGIEWQLLDRKRGNDPKFWAWQRLHELVWSEPEEAWKVIEAIRQANGSDLIIANLAAGPLEDLLATHGEQFIERVETLSRRDAQFRRLLGGVWRSSISEKVWTRLRAVAGPPF